VCVCVCVCVCVHIVLFADGVDCWSEYSRLHYDPLTKRHYNAPGVDTRVPGWGGTHSIEYIDPSWTAWALGNLGAYAKRFVDGISTWLGSRVVSVLHSGAEGPGFKSQPRRYRVTVIGKLFTPTGPLFTKQ